MTRDEIEEVLRHRILRGLQAGSLRVGDRLPSARQYAAEFGVDYRVILAAYKALVAEHLVELRARGGVYVARAPGAGAALGLPEEWLEDIFVQGLAREIPMRELPEWLRRCADTLRLRAAVVAGTSDQVAGLGRELHDEYGLEPIGVDAASLTEGGGLPSAARPVDIVITTPAFESAVREAADRLGVPTIVVHIRPDLIGGEWRLVLRRPAYVLVEDARFEAVIRRFFADTPGRENLRILVLGRDDPASIPDGAPTYVTRGAREALGDRPLAGRILPSARMLSGETARELVRFILARNLEALRARGR